MLCACTNVQPFTGPARYTILNDHINEIARQEEISWQDAATALKKAGVDGVDVYTDINSCQMSILEETGFEFPCAVAGLDFVNGDCDEEGDKALEFAAKYNIGRMLIVPGFFGDSFTDEDYKLFINRLKAFMKKAEKQGCEITLEDFDNWKSPCCGMKNLERIFKDIPQIKHSYDTGNYLFAKEDPVAALDMFRKRVTHVHLKDRVSVDNMNCPAVGEGVIPFDEIIPSLRADGYDGWYMIELYGSRNMLQDVILSVRNVNGMVK